MQLTVSDVAKLLFVSEKTVYRWINQGNLPAYRVNHQYRFNRAELLEWATAQKINFSPAIFEETEAQSTPMPRLTEALRSGGIHYRVGGTHRESVLHSIVETMALPESVDREFLYQVLLAREAMGSTAVGDGIAIPHVRNPIVLRVTQPTISLCFLEKPVDFGALDGQPVHTLFSLISPSVRAHLHLLSRMAYALRDQQCKDVILRQGSRDEIFNELNRVEDGIRKPAQAEVQEHV